MRLLLVTTLFPNSAQPTRATYNLYHLQAIQGLGHEVAVVAPITTFPGGSLLGFSPRVPRREQISGIDVWHPAFHRTPFVLRHLHHHMYRACVRKTLRKAIDTFKPDHILVSFAYPDGAAIGALCSDWGIPWSLAVLGSDYYVRRWQTRIREDLFRTLRTAPLIICPGESLRQALVEAGMHPDNIVAFQNGVDHDLFTVSEKAREPYVLFVGNWVEVKGIDRLISAWKRLERRDLQLRLVGSGGQEGQLRQQCRDLKIEKQVKFIDQLPREKIAEQMQQALLLCLPSRSEGMPNVVLEALACGTPVVGSDAGEMPNLIRPAENGYIFPNLDEVTKELTDTLRLALDTEWDPHAIADSVAAFTWERAAKTVIEALQSRHD